VTKFPFKVVCVDNTDDDYLFPRDRFRVIDE
jgi:hypothetical protein